MFDTEITLNRFMLDYCDRLWTDLSDEEFVQPAHEGGHSPQWVLGHLTMAADYAAVMLGLRPAAAKQIREAFRPGQAESVQAGEPFTRTALSTGLRPAYERLYDAARAADGEEMNQPHGAEILANTAIKTRGEFIAHILTTHFALHVGQLSAWRRAFGRPPLF